MKLLGTFVFAVFALVAANFASAAPAKADSFGVYVGNGGFGIHVNDYGRRHHRYNRRGCWDPYYGRYVPCGYYNNYYPGYYGYYGGGGYRSHYRGRHRDYGWDNGWRGRNQWHGGHRGRNHGWDGGGRRGHDGWRGGRRGGGDGYRGRGGDRQHRGH
jgi:hypothetical protein